MADAADKVVADDERAMALFEQQRAAARSLHAASVVPAHPMHCLECGETIPVARLVALPHTRRCAPCAEDR